MPPFSWPSIDLSRPRVPLLDAAIYFVSKAGNAPANLEFDATTIDPMFAYLHDGTLAAFGVDLTTGEVVRIANAWKNATAGGAHGKDINSVYLGPDAAESYWHGSEPMHGSVLRQAADGRPRYSQIEIETSGLVKLVTSALGIRLKTHSAGGRSPETRTAEDAAKAELKRRMSEAPASRAFTQVSIWPEMKKEFPLVSKTAFKERIWPVCARDFPAYQRGTSLKNQPGGGCRG